jgi:hypothetical protein
MTCFLYLQGSKKQYAFIIWIGVACLRDGGSMLHTGRQSMCVNVDMFSSCGEGLEKFCFLGSPKTISSSMLFCSVHPFWWCTKLQVSSQKCWWVRCYEVTEPGKLMTVALRNTKSKKVHFLDLLTLTVNLRINESSRSVFWMFPTEF